MRSFKQFQDEMWFARRKYATELACTIPKSCTIMAADWWLKAEHKELVWKLESLFDELEKNGSCTFKIGEDFRLPRVGFDGFSAFTAGMEEWREAWNGVIKVDYTASIEDGISITFSAE